MQTKSVAFFLSFSFFIIEAGNAWAQTVDMVGPAGSGAYGSSVTVLPNGNYVIVDSTYSEGGVSKIGAVYLYNGNSNTLISTLKGSSANDEIGAGVYGVVVLSNGNFVIASPFWNNGSATKAGAVTWCDGNTGVNGIVNGTNSLVGSTANDGVGSGNPIIPLSNGSYIVKSSFWANGTASAAGAVTWCKNDGTTVGFINAGNSLIGSTANDVIGYNDVIVLNNGNYVVNSPHWDNGTLTDAGAVTWCKADGTTVGVLNGTNSLVGSSINDYVGVGGIYPLTNGNYVVSSYLWNATKGAATWCNGLTGRTGTINITNSLLGTQISDNVGAIITSLKNGNFVITSPIWNNYKGSVTFGDGSKPIVGTINSTNSLVGSFSNDETGYGGITVLSNGNYVVSTPFWNNNLGAATWGNGISGIVGTITAGNSLVGTLQGDYVSSDASRFNKVTALNNGNYVVCSYNWSSGLGASTWCKADGTTVGTISGTNSLVGSNANDNVGINGAVKLGNGNYVVLSQNWNNNLGASTWCSGTSGLTGIVAASNSLVGSQNIGTNINGALRAIALSNGNYVIASRGSNGIGFLTFCKSDGTTKGIINNSNSLTGNTSGDNIGNSTDTLSYGNYVTKSPYYNNNTGVITWGNGNGGTIGIPNSCNSVFNIPMYGGYGINYMYDSIYNFLLVGRKNNIVSRYYPALGAAIPSSNDNSSATISGNSPFVFPTTTGCGQIAALTPSGTSPVSGSVTAKTWLESPQPTYFVARHYEITPATNPSTSTGTITLYFTQADFDGFNNQSPAPALLLPNGPNDAVGKSHLLVQKEGGVSNVGTGLPGTYPGTVTTIDPADSNIVWNKALQRWEVTFDVTGFSGFFIKTQNAVSILPLTLLNFSGTHQGNNNLLQWTTFNEVGTKTFAVESSANTNSFASIGNVAALGRGNYAYTDNNPILNRTYYRLKMIDADGKFTYSSIIWISTSGAGNINFYPNPVNSVATLNINNNNNLIGTKAQLIDVGGRLLQQITINHNQEQLDLTALPAGLYLLKLNNGKVVKIMKQ